MLHDIYALTMGGRFETRRGDSVPTTGTWTYRGGGNAEITLEAESRLEDGSRLAVRIHSAERQLDEFSCRSIDADGNSTCELKGLIAGHVVTLSRSVEGGADESGNFDVPVETIYDGPTPIWMIHLMMTALPPADRAIVAPVLYVKSSDAGMLGGFYKVERTGKHVSIIVLDVDGQEQNRMEVEISDDGCPTRITDGDSVTEVVRLPTLVDT